MWRRAGLIFLALCCFGAAQAGDSDMSDPPYMVTTADCALGFERYRRSLLPHYFVLSADGEFCTYSYCMGGCRKNNLLAATLSYCEQTTGKGPCQVYAFGGQVDPARAKELQRRIPQ